MNRDERGQSLVEAALVLPILLLLIVGIIDIGRLAFTYSSLHFTAQETVRIGGLGGTDDELYQFAKNHFAGGDSSTLEISITPSNNRKSGEYMTVTLTYKLRPLTPLMEKLFPQIMETTVNSTIRVE